MLAYLKDIILGFIAVVLAIALLSALTAAIGWLWMTDVRVALAVTIVGLLLVRGVKSVDTAVIQGVK